jgi:hypothetical protein
VAYRPVYLSAYLPACPFVCFKARVTQIEKGKVVVRVERTASSVYQSVRRAVGQGGHIHKPSEWDTVSTDVYLWSYGGRGGITPLVLLYMEEGSCDISESCIGDWDCCWYRVWCRWVGAFRRCELPPSAGL